ncbi:MAG: 16S rRNA (cytosine(1402)-N(4))-methyltransferase, partial [Polynucleobacter sp. 35-46-207]
MNITHRPVLLAEAVTALISGPLITPSDTSKNILMIDGTFGRGGHTQALLSRLGVNARMISFDKDLEAIAVAEKINDSRLRIVHDSF